MEKWISVYEKLPDSNRDVLCVVNMGDDYVWQSVCSVEKSAKSTKFYSEVDTDLTRYVTHWKELDPLPEGVKTVL